MQFGARAHPEQGRQCNPGQGYLRSWDGEAIRDRGDLRPNTDLQENDKNDKGRKFSVLYQYSRPL